MGSGNANATGKGQYHTELLALDLGRWIVERLSDLGAVAGEVVYDAQAAEALVAGAPQRQRDPVLRAILWSVSSFVAVHWWLQGHVEAPDGDGEYKWHQHGNGWVDEYVGVAACGSAHGHRVALPLAGGGIRVAVCARPAEVGVAYPPA